MQDRILLVDDESLILKALERLLKRSGYQVLTAESGAEAIAAGQPLPGSNIRFQDAWYDWGGNF